MNDRAERLNGIIERRTLALDCELRAAADDTLTFTGYASLFNVPYDMYGGPDKGGWTETVDPAAFDRTLKARPDVVLLRNHEGLPLARTTSGTMTLKTDGKGLAVNASLDRRDPDVQALEVKMERRDLSQMSFAFRTIRQEWDNEEESRTLLEVSLDRGDVSIVTNGAQPATSSQLRGMQDVLDYLGAADLDEALVEMRAHDDSLAALTGAQQQISRLIAQLRPAQTRRLSVKHAKRLMLLDA